MKRDKAWREFEKLVAAIEAQAAPRDAVVKSPDRIRDLVTGRMREVDASIRVRLGTADILLTIECRKRGRTPDDRWIEQLASKRQKIGAAKTIAVSASGFTDPARATASQYGIELRVLSEVEPSDIEAWLTGQGVVHLFRQIEAVKCEVALAASPDEMFPVQAEVPQFFHQIVASPFPAVVFLQFLELTQANHFWSIPLDGTKTRLTFDLDATASDLIPVPLSPMPRTPPGPLQIELHGARQVVRALRLSALVSYEAAVFSPEDGRHYDYQGSANQVQHTVFEGELFDLPVRFDHQFETDESSVRARFGKTKKRSDG